MRSAPPNVRGGKSHDVSQWIVSNRFTNGIIYCVMVIPDPLSPTEGYRKLSPLLRGPADISKMRFYPRTGPARQITEAAMLDEFTLRIVTDDASLPIGILTIEGYQDEYRTASGILNGPSVTKTNWLIL